MKISSGIIHCHSIQKAKIIPRMKKIIIISEFLRISPNCRHRRTGNFLPGGAVNHLPKKFSQVARIFPKRTVEKKRGPYDATTEAALAYEGGAIL